MNTQGMFEDLWRVLLADNGNHTVHFFDDLLASTPNDVDAWLGRSALLGKLKKYPEAIESFTRTIQVASGNELAMAYAGRALNYYALQNFQKAFNDCERALELNPNEAIFWKTKGVLLCHLDKNIDALSAFTKGLELNPKDEKMIGLRKFLEETFQEKLILQLEKSEIFFCNTIKNVAEELKEQFKYNSYELEKSNEFMQDILKEYKKISDVSELKFNYFSNLIVVPDKCFTIYYFIKAVESGLNAVYPIFNQEKLEDSRNFFTKAKEIANRDEDYDRLREIASIAYLLDQRATYAANKAVKSSNRSDLSGLIISNGKFIAFGLGAFAVVLLIAGQWLISLICFGIFWFLWQIVH